MVENASGELVNAQLVAGADVVGRAVAAVERVLLDRRAVVVDVQPLSPVGARGIDRQREPVERTGGEQGMTFSGNWYGPALLAL